MIVSGLKYALECEGYIATHCENVKSSIETINSNRFDLVILDIGLPDGTGFDVAKNLTSIPIIFLTAVDDEQKIVKAFDLGAADYVTKPFRVRELLARIKRTLNQNNTERSYINIGDVKIDTDSGKVYVAENMIQLTALEYRLLLIFANQKGRLLTRTQILESIWDYEGNFVEDNTLTVYIKRLREKLGDAIKIETVRGVGYRAN
ncbi:DNA-binding response regulator [Candidatus Epulonipiscium fishelsonii]|uniref:DNA-binding response regulator n=1 Tax=Candidatus Epulonipiscium fishelsonii TaxID=77094 RepID=A0ACC8XHR1_9FIRM|nr:DNA-binding response regulator [Epulopiscium sp. SCG-D08WGA-EpuloA1]